MFKSLLLAASWLAVSFALPLHASQLTALETGWLHAAAPVLDYAKSIALPVDIIVQPKAPAGAVPLAMGFAQGRCKLLLSMRGNPDDERLTPFAAADALWREGLLASE